MARLKKRGKVKFNFIGLLLIILAIVAVVGFIWIQNGYTYINNITYKDVSIPRQFTGYKIAHIANIDNEKINIASKLEKEEVNIIVISGGLVDTDGNYNNSVKLLNELNNVAPTYFVLQSQDMTYKDEIISSTSAKYLNGDGITIESAHVDVMDYIEYACDTGMISEIKKDTDESKQYIKYIEQVLEEDKNKTIELIGMDCHSENIYDDLDMIYPVFNNTSEITMSLLGNINRCSELGEIGVEIFFAGGTYGLKNYNQNFDGTLNDKSFGAAKVFSTAGICKEIPDTRRFMNLKEIQIITLDDNKIYKRNPLERFFGIFVKDVDSLFEGDEGFKEHKYQYEPTYDTY